MTLKVLRYLGEGSLLLGWAALLRVAVEEASLVLDIASGVWSEKGLNRGLSSYPFKAPKRLLPEKKTLH